MCVEMKQFLFIYSFIFIILMICVDVHGNAVNMAQSNKNNLEWSNYYQKNYNPHLRKMIAPDYVEQQPSHPLNVIESNQHKNGIYMQMHLHMCYGLQTYIQTIILK